MYVRLWVKLCFSADIELNLHVETSAVSPHGELESDLPSVITGPAEVLSHGFTRENRFIPFKNITGRHRGTPAKDSDRDQKVMRLEIQTFPHTRVLTIDKEKGGKGGNERWMRTT